MIPSLARRVGVGCVPTERNPLKAYSLISVSWDAGPLARETARHSLDDFLRRG